MIYILEKNTKIKNVLFWEKRMRMLNKNRNLNKKKRRERYQSLKFLLKNEVFLEVLILALIAS